MTKMIGSVEIFEPQIKAGREIWNNHFSKRFEDKKSGDNNVLLVAEPQQGKTGTIIYVMNEMLNYMKRIGATSNDFQIIYLTSISDTQLQEQTVGRIYDAFMNFELGNEVGIQFITSPKMNYGSNATGKRNVEPKAIVVEHIGGKNKREKLVGKVSNSDSISKLVKTEGIKYRLVIFDECHMALGREGVTHSILESLGLDNISQLDSNTGRWGLRPKNTCFLHVSATPFPHISSDNGYATVAIDVDDNYYGIPEMLESGALEYYESDTDLVNKVKEYYMDNDVRGGCIIRVSKAQGSLKTRIEGALDSNGYKRGDSNKSYLEFTSNGGASEKLISELDNEITMSYGYGKNSKGELVFIPSLKKKSVMFIKNALRVGKTLPAPVSLWVETSKDPNDDTIIQSIGRVCSRNPEFKKTRILVSKQIFDSIKLSVEYYLNVRKYGIREAFEKYPQSSNYNRVTMPVVRKNGKPNYSWDVGFTVIDHPDLNVPTETLLRSNVDNPIVKKYVDYIDTYGGSEFRMSAGKGSNEFITEKNRKTYMDIASGKQNFLFHQASTNVLYINPRYIEEISDMLTEEELYTLKKYSGKVLVFDFVESNTKPTSTLKDNTILQAAD